MEIFPENSVQAGLLMILIIAVPFLIIMIIIYLVFAGAYPDSEQCKNLCALSPTNPSYFIPLRKRKRFIKRSAPIDTYSWARRYYPAPHKRHFSPALKTSSIGALLYTPNDGITFELKCPVPLIAQTWALTTEKCVAPSVDLSLLRIRLGSNFWDRNGAVTTVAKMATNAIQGVEVVAVNFRAQRDAFVLPFKVPKMRKDYREEKLQIGLYLPYYFEIVLVDAHQMACNVGLCMKQETVMCEMEVNAPLFSNEYLFGLHLKTDCQLFQNFYMESYKLHNWLEQISVFI